MNTTAFHQIPTAHLPAPWRWGVHASPCLRARKCNLLNLAGFGVRVGPAAFEGILKHVSPAP